MHTFLYSLFGVTFQLKLASYRNYSINLQSRSIAWFLYKSISEQTNMVRVQGNVYRPLVSSSYNHRVKVIFFTRRTAHVRLNG